MTVAESSLFDELKKIQKAIKAPKNKRNDFGKYDYRTAEEILEAYKQIASLPLTLTDEIVLIGKRYYVKSTATILGKKEEVSVIAYARESLRKKGMDDSQITGAASSYARKYALSGLLALDNNKDFDDPDLREKEEVHKSKPAKQATESDWNERRRRAMEKLKDKKRA